MLGSGAVSGGRWKEGSPGTESLGPPRLTTQAGGRGVVQHHISLPPVQVLGSLLVAHALAFTAHSCMKGQDASDMSAWSY